MAKKKNKKKDNALVQFYNQVKENKKPQRSIRTGRAIEAKLAQLKELNPYFSDEKAEDEHQPTIDVNKQNKPALVNNVNGEIAENYAEAALYVLEPADLEELTLTEVKSVWEKRYDLCGSDRVAAEALAIFEVDTGITDYYRGWQFYINHPDIIAFRERQRCTEDQDSAPANTPVINKNSHPASQHEVLQKGYNLIQVQRLTLDELRVAWSQRPSSFFSIEAASEALARVRFESKIDTTKLSWEQLISHHAIKEISSVLEMERENQPISVIRANPEHMTSEKVYGLVKQQLRVGQSSFRDEVLDVYKAICCITGCTEITSLEAAHIRPYSGQVSNVVRNSLLLRADIHKLFDRFLISIHPIELTLIISNRISDDYYRSLNGKKVFKGTFSPSPEFLDEHYKTFIKVEKSSRSFGTYLSV